MAIISIQKEEEKMATSSIFHNVIISEPKAAEKIAMALEESAKNPHMRKEGTTSKVLNDPSKIKKVLADWER